MKTLRNSLLIAILTLIISVAFVAAQDTSENLAYNDLAAGVIVHTVEAGTFAAAEDGNYTLTLENVPHIAALYFTSPSILARNYHVGKLSGDWVYANELGDEALMGNAHLQFDTVSVVLEVSTPIWDEEAGTLTYTVTFVEGMDAGVSMKDAMDIPASFENASLFIEINPAFISTLISGREARLSEIRANTIGCMTCKP
jgi:hypothetical protein